MKLNTQILLSHAKYGLKRYRKKVEFFIGKGEVKDYGLPRIDDRTGDPSNPVKIIQINEFGRVILE